MCVCVCVNNLKLIDYSKSTKRAEIYISAMSDRITTDVIPLQMKLL